MNHREAVGGLWDEVGLLQYRFMKIAGLKPHHKLLDIGCGSLRGGIHFADYLDVGNYYGIDKDYDLVFAGVEKELSKYTNKPVKTLIDDNFSFEKFDVMFDFAIAQSVFTHLCRMDIAMCLRKLAKVLKPGGKLYATYFEGPHTNFVKQKCGIVTYPNSDPYHQSYFEFYDRYNDRNTWTVNYIGVWGHPRGQLMLEFIKE